MHFRRPRGSTRSLHCPPSLESSSPSSSSTRRTAARVKCAGGSGSCWAPTTTAPSARHGRPLLRQVNSAAQMLPNAAGSVVHHMRTFHRTTTGYKEGRLREICVGMLHDCTQTPDAPARRWYCTLRLAEGPPMATSASEEAPGVAVPGRSPGPGKREPAERRGPVLVLSEV